jgi:predicted nucleic-acid-binding protein
MKKYFIDTNYILRLQLQDIESQYRIVYRLFQEAALAKIEIYTSSVTFFEIYWVLKSNYGLSKSECIIQLTKVIDISFLEIENKHIIKAALNLFSNSNIDLEDCYYIKYSKKYPDSEFATFDKKLQKYC